MRTVMTALFLGAAVVVAAPAFGDEKAPTQEKKAPAVEKCEHGVQKTLCTRCNPKLKAVFKAKGDWCGEHDRPESQCAICKPQLEKEGVKP